MKEGAELEIFEDAVAGGHEPKGVTADDLKAGRHPATPGAFVHVLIGRLRRVDHRLRFLPRQADGSPVFDAPLVARLHPDQMLGQGIGGQVQDGVGLKIFEFKFQIVVLRDILSSEYRILHFQSSITEFKRHRSDDRRRFWRSCYPSDFVFVVIVVGFKQGLASDDMNTQAITDLFTPTCLFHLKARLP